MIVSYSDFVNKFLWRNNVIRGSIIMALVMAFFMFAVTGFVFYYLDEKDENVANYVIPIQLCFMGINQFYEKIFSYVSSVYVDFESKKICMNRFICVCYQKSICLFFVIFFVPLSFFFEKKNLFFKLVEVALLNMGIGVFVMLCSSAVFGGYLTINTSVSRNFKKGESITFTFLLMWFLVWIIFILDDYLINIIGSALARTLIIGFEVTFILLFKTWIPICVRIFHGRRYIKLIIYLSD